jgi:hypothetical protein
LVYESAGSVEEGLLVSGAELVRTAGAAHRMPVAILDSDPADHAAWLAGARAAVDRVLGAG